jgi:hypothetical protein
VVSQSRKRCASGPVILLGVQQNNDKYQAVLRSLLGEFETLGARLELLLNTHEERELSDVAFALLRAKEASDHAAALIRLRIRKTG